eukprot:EG_transcript_9748
MPALEAFGYGLSQLKFFLASGRRIAAALHCIGVVVDAEAAAAVFAYTQEDAVGLYGKCNDACRTPGAAAEKQLAQYRDYLHHLTQAISGLPNFYGTAYRGVGTRVPPGCYTVGHTITWQPFTSTTQCAMCAVRFVKECNRRLQGSLFVLHVKAGKDVQALSQFPHEYEVLLGLNSVWQVLGRCETEAEKKEEVPDFGEYDLSELDVYILKQL